GPRERRPERRLHNDSDVPEVESGTPASEAGERQLQSPLLQPSIGEVLAPHPGNREQRDPGGDRGRRFGLAGATNGAVENAAPAPCERLGQLLGPLAPITPCDDGQEEQGGAPGLRRAGIEREPGDLDARFSKAQKPFGTDVPAQGASPGDRYRAPAERVDPAAPARLPFRPHEGGTNGSNVRPIRIAAIRCEARPSP